MSQVNIRIDDKIKKEADELFQSMGLNFSSAVTIFLLQALREGGIPFNVTTRPHIERLGISHSAPPHIHEPMQEDFLHLDSSIFHGDVITSLNGIIKNQTKAQVTVSEGNNIILLSEAEYQKMNKQRSSDTVKVL